jgi:hypothetical protein
VERGPDLAVNKAGRPLCALRYAAWDVTDVPSFGKHTSDGALIVASVFENKQGKY